MRTLTWLAAVAALALNGCGGSSEETTEEYPPIEEPGGGGAEPPTTNTAEPIAEPTPPPPPPVQVVAGESTAIEGQNPTLRILAPRNGSKVRTGPVKLRAQLRNWELAPDPGNHVHVIIDNEPYIAVRDVTQPLDLNALAQEHLGHDLTPGTHVVRMFPSRPQHESVKTDGAFAWTLFHFQSPTDGFTFDPNAPLLTFSRPKGCNPAGQRVLLDFYLTNVPALAADGTRVRYTIDGSVTGDITSWVPHWIENLQPGDHTIRLQLIGADGNALAGPFNDTTRTISVQPECPAAAGHAHGAAPATPATPAAPANP